MISEFCETPTILILNDTSVPGTTMQEFWCLPVGQCFSSVEPFSLASYCFPSFGLCFCIQWLINGTFYTLEENPVEMLF